jgi:hypothetical protein
MKHGRTKATGGLGHEGAVAEETEKEAVTA